ncbi:hypothetical protein ABW19_dt0209769 [Dactylella cylindrospora]|nr:hypothetical protein ABW19_dt0209769 [Dactylella cylindrospora]
MAKRRHDSAPSQGDSNQHDGNSYGQDHKNDDHDHDEGEESGEETELINVDFEFFDPQEHDFHGIKLLLRQLFDADSALLDLSALTDLILQQKLVGSTVKVDGREGDPYSFLTLVNWKSHQGLECVQTLVSYLKERCSGTPIESTLSTLFVPDAPTNTAIVLSERLINMPAEISPPAYKMLLEEIEFAIEDNEPYTFDHFLIVSKVYTEVESKLDPGASRPPKRQKSARKGSSGSPRVFDFHPEDGAFLKQASREDRAVYKYKHEPPAELADSKRAFQEFGILPKVCSTGP